MNKKISLSLASLLLLSSSMYAAGHGNGGAGGIRGALGTVGIIVLAHYGTKVVDAWFSSAKEKGLASNQLDHLERLLKEKNHELHCMREKQIKEPHNFILERDIAQFEKNLKALQGLYEKEVTTTRSLTPDTATQPSTALATHAGLCGHAH